MPPEKRNNFLDADESDDDVPNQDYDSEVEIKKGARSSKRRKLEDPGSDIESDASDAESDLLESAGDDGDENQQATHGEKKADDANKKDVQPSSKSAKSKLPKVQDRTGKNPIAKKNLVVTEEQIKKSGVLYISRIPPFMKPHKLRSLLEPLGTINRTYLMPEDPTSQARRRRNGGSKKRLFTEGWVEFVDKRCAKRAHEFLNTRPIGGKKGSYYRDDIWSMVYLKGFKWGDLTAQIERENEERAARHMTEVRKTKRENELLSRNVERGKEMDGIRKKREKTRRDEEKQQQSGTKTEGKAVDINQYVSMPKGSQHTDLQPETEGRVLRGIL